MNAFQLALLQTDTEKRSSYYRLPVLFLAAMEFAVVMRLSRFSDPQQVLRFLLTPFHHSFDPALAYLALGALPLLSIAYALLGKDHKGYVTCTSSIPTGNVVDMRLLGGAALFGIGWGIVGICRASFI